MTDYTGIDNLEVMRLASNYNHYLCDVVRRHDPGDGPAIDFGAGIGTFSSCIRGDRSRVLCVDADIALRTQLKAAGYQTVESVLDIPDESTAYVYSLNVLEHIADDAAVLRELARRIRPGGRLLLYLPAFDLLYSSMDRKVGHYRRYTRAGASALLAGTGLTIVVARYEDFLGFFAALAFKWTDQLGSGDIDARALVLYDRWMFPVSRMLSRVFGRWIGKNLLLVAEKDQA
jgi:SAM-dependent methyltransferase